MITAVGVVVPAADEQATVGACLDSVVVACARLRTIAPCVDVRVVVVLDSCVDQTASIVAEHRGVRAVSCSVGRAGAARAIGAQVLLDEFATSSDQLWLANTDADSCVPADWLTTHVDQAQRGADLVLGTVLPDVGLSAAVERAWHDNHRLHEDHPHVHGANLGIKADAYLALGGWPSLATGEDVELAARAESAGRLHIVRTARIPVRTSVRLTGRAPRGFATYLRELTSVQGEIAV
ncbi:MAG: glycosyltransferase [Jatrophihabitantaceae bacterium]